MLAGMGAIAGMVGGATGGQPPASYVFSGAGFGAGEALERTNVTSSPDRKALTFSCWSKVDTYIFFAGDNAFFNYWLETATQGEQLTLRNTANNAIMARKFNLPFSAYSINERGGTSSSTAWRHCVYRYDINNGTAADRVRVYIDGSQITAVSPVNPATSVNLEFLTNGEVLNIGSEAYSDGRIAFAELIEGQSLAPTEFAFNNGGTWTAKKYSGAYGDYGFRLDGSKGVDGCEDVSGNGMDFTPTNWNVVDNLDYVELPPRNF